MDIVSHLNATITPHIVQQRLGTQNSNQASVVSLLEQCYALVCIQLQQDGLSHTLSSYVSGNQASDNQASDNQANAANFFQTLWSNTQQQNILQELSHSHHIDATTTSTLVHAASLVAYQTIARLAGTQHKSVPDFLSTYHQSTLSHLPFWAADVLPETLLYPDQQSQQATVQDNPHNNQLNQSSLQPANTPANHLSNTSVPASHNHENNQAISSHTNHATNHTPHNVINNDLLNKTHNAHKTDYPYQQDESEFYETYAEDEDESIDDDFDQFDDFDDVNNANNSHNTNHMGKLIAAVVGVLFLLVTAWFGKQILQSSAEKRSNTEPAQQGAETEDNANINTNTNIQTDASASNTETVQISQQQMLKNFEPLVPSLSISLDSKGDIYACHGYVANGQVQTDILIAIDAIFSGQNNVCVIDVNRHYKPLITSANRIERALSLLKNSNHANNASIYIKGKQIEVNTMDSSHTMQVVSDIKAIMPEANVVSANESNIAERIAQGLARSQHALSNITAKSLRKSGKSATQLAEALSLQYFDFGHTEGQIPAANQPILNQAAALLKEAPKVKLLILVHSNQQADSNKHTNSQANAIKAYLVKQGVKEKQLVVNGLGDQYPMADNATPLGKFRNNRVEFVVYDPSMTTMGAYANVFNLSQSNTPINNPTNEPEPNSLPQTNSAQNDSILNDIQSDIQIEKQSKQSQPTQSSSSNQSSTQAPKPTQDTTGNNTNHSNLTIDNPELPIINQPDIEQPVDNTPSVPKGMSTTEVDALIETVISSEVPPSDVHVE